MTEQISGTPYIVAAPSGGGKTSLVKNLIDDLDNIEVSISHTTRPQRRGETDGADYFFIDKTQFSQMILQNEFVEHAKVFDHYYGTSVRQIKDRLQKGIDIVLDIDWQGAQQIRKLFPETISIFIIPPSLDTLQERLEQRRRDNAQIIKKRMRQAQEEMSHYKEFDYLIVNDNFNEALIQLKSIVIANRLRLSQQLKRQAKLLSFLLSSK